MLNNYDSIISVCEDHGGWLCGGFRWSEYNNEGVPVDYDLSKNRPRRQDMGVKYRENGAIYITSNFNVLKNRNRLSGKVGLYKMPRQRSFEIDSIEDLEEIRKWLNK
jgi:N-acylneuraminate cytidylyltransferase